MIKTRRRFVSAVMIVSSLQTLCGNSFAQNPASAEAFFSQLPFSPPTLFSSSSHLSKYKIVAGPRVVQQDAMKSVYDHFPIQTATPQPYAYGWFGAKSSPDWSRQFGYGRRHTQWSLK